MGPTWISWPVGFAPPRAGKARLRAYLADDGVGYRARGAPTSSRARVEACSSDRARAVLGPRHTFDRGASCATPSREVVLHRSCISRPPRKRMRAPGRTAKGARNGRWLCSLGRSGSGWGPRNCRGDVSPRAAGGGPIHARLTLGNSAVPASRMLRSDAGEVLGEPPASDAHFTCCWGCR